MFKKNFVRLCNERNVSPCRVCRDCGLSNATFSAWRYDTIPRETTLQKLADYFGVSTDDLLSADVCQNERDDLVRLLSTMTDSQIRAVADYAEHIKEQTS